MNKDYKSLELDKILIQLAEQTSFEDARNMALNLEPSEGLFEAGELLKETSDAHSLTGRFGTPPFGNIHNMTNAARRAESGAVLTSLELLRVSSLLGTVRKIVEWRKKSESVQTCLDMRFNALSPNKYLENKISSSILSEDEIADNASPELLSIRKKIAAKTTKIREQLDKLIR